MASPDAQRYMGQGASASILMYRVSHEWPGNTWVEDARPPLRVLLADRPHYRGT